MQGGSEGHDVAFICSLGFHSVIFYFAKGNKYNIPVMLLF